MAWRPIPLDRVVLAGAWTVEERYSLSFWDALIVSAAQVTDSRYLLTEDLQDGQLIGGVKVLDPFRTDPTAVL
jgi:predicted nucleic acid-binding protein